MEKVQNPSNSVNEKNIIYNLCTIYEFKNQGDISLGSQ
jgi:hypothetical protein